MSYLIESGRRMLNSELADIGFRLHGEAEYGQGSMNLERLFALPTQMDPPCIEGVYVVAGSSEWNTGDRDVLVYAGLNLADDRLESFAERNNVSMRYVLSKNVKESNMRVWRDGEVLIQPFDYRLGIYRQLLLNP